MVDKLYYKLTSDKDAIVQEIARVFTCEFPNITEYYENLANAFLAGSGCGDVEWCYRTLQQVTVVWFCKDIILPPTSKGEKWDQYYMKDRMKHLDKHIGEAAPEVLVAIKSWMEFFTTLVWIVTCDEDYTDAFEQFTAIPYKDGQEFVLA